MSSGARIDIPSGDAARFNEIRDEWRRTAVGCALSKSALRVSSVLPVYLNQQFGYAFPTNQQLASDIRASIDTVKLGLRDLEDAGLIERETTTKRDEKGEAVGRQRRIFLCRPKTLSAQKVAKGEGLKSPKGKGQNRAGEGVPVPSNIPDKATPDKDTGLDVGKLGAAPFPLRQTPPSPNPPSNSHFAKKNLFPLPSSWGTDDGFLRAFDRNVREKIGSGEIGAGEIDCIAGNAFDRATSEQGDMPFHWTEVLKIRDSTMADWFRYRASSLFHLQKAA